MRPQDMKAYNEQIILELFKYNQNLTRAQIVRLSGLSAPTVSSLVDGLIQKEMLTELTTFTNKRGRPALTLQLTNRITQQYEMGLSQALLY